MARKRKHAAHENHERWLISYADFITLLFAFFVVMFASSQTDKSKAKQISAAVKEALEKGGVPAAVHEILGGTVDDKGKGNAMMKGPGGSQKQLPPKTDIPESKVAVTDLMPSMTYLTRSLADEIKAGKVEVHLDARGLVVSLRQAAFFPSGGDDIAASSTASLEKIAKTIRDLPNPVRLEGHTDSLPIHTERFRSNWELSAARSIAMLQLFVSRYDIPGDRFAVEGYGDTKPLDSNDSATGRAHNRRVDIVILNQQVIVKQPGAGGGLSTKNVEQASLKAAH
ncbi:MAG TPA: flagellar motor protein MotB [Bryobacteraceae bacterium]|jgi:chemotaxis protein MotB|nr:flagellar motor protein MotB [Bryobacteraceae bacterium]